MIETNSDPTANEEGEASARIAALERENRKLRREISHLKEAVAQEKIARATVLNRQKVNSFVQKERDRYLAMLLANSPSIILFLNHAGRIDFCTDYLVKKTGLKRPTEMMGHTLSEILARYLDEASHVILLEQLDTVLRTNAPVAFDITVDFFNDGVKEDFAGLLVPMRDAEQEQEQEQERCGVMLMLHDVTDLKRSREEALQASRAKSDFLSNMSHEIRTPLNAIIGMTELAVRDAESPPIARDHMLTVKQAGINLLAIVNDILDLSRIEQDKLEIIPGRYLLESLINDVVSVIRMRVSDKPLCFTVRADSSMPRALIGDEMRIRQILVNLLGNAVKFTESGAISLTVRGEETGGGGFNLLAEVADSGVGIKPEDVGGIFDAYTQIHQRKGVQTEGTGLGLAITKGFVNAMDGSISVRSEYGKGSVFTVSLPQKIHTGEPLASVADPGGKGVLVYAYCDRCRASIVYALENLGVRCAAAADDDEFRAEIRSGEWPLVFVPASRFENARRVYEETGISARTVLMAEYGDSIPEQALTALYTPVYSVSVANLLNGVQDSFSYNTRGDSSAMFTAPGAYVLLVDDIETNLKVAEGLMRPYEMKVDLCRSGEEALDAVRATRYDLVFMDHKMPGMDGVETVRRIRAMGADDPYYEDLPIVALTANAVSGMKEMFMENGFSDFLSKPISLAAMNAVLKKWIDRSMWQSAQREDGPAAEGSGAAAHIQIEGVNVAQGLALARGDAGLYMETLAVFRKDGLEKIREIGASLEAGDLRLFTIYVHALKSACANVGAWELSQAAKALELAGNRGDVQHIRANISALISSLTLLLERVEAAMAAYREERREEEGGFGAADKAGKAGQAGKEALAAGLAGLKTAIAEMDATTMNHAVKELQKLARSESAGALIGDIRDSILLAEYDEAIRLIDAFQTEEQA